MKTRYIKKLNSHSWVRDELLGKLFKNAAILFTGNTAASLLGLASLALTARALGVEEFGILVLITTYVLIVDKLVNFQSWQAIIKYGTEALEKNQEEDLKSLLKFGFLLDSSTAALGALVSASAAGLVGSWLNWNQEQILMAAVYSGTVLFHINGTPIAVLRLFDKFSKTAIQQVYASAFKLSGVVLASSIGADLWGFLLIWALTDILGKLLLIYYALQEVSKRKLAGIYQSKLGKMSDRFNGIWNFVWVTNVHSSVKLGLKELDTILIGSILGASGAGLYKIVKAICSTVAKVTDPLYQAVYPDLARQVSRKSFKEMRSLIIRSSGIVFVILIPVLSLYYVAGEYILELILGEQYLDAYIPSLIYLVGTGIAMLTFSFHPTLLSFGKANLSLYVLIFSVLVYLVFLYYLTSHYGLIGASFSYVIFYATWGLIQFYVIKTLLNKEMSFDEKRRQ